MTPPYAESGTAQTPAEALADATAELQHAAVDLQAKMPAGRKIKDRLLKGLVYASGVAVCLVLLFIIGYIFMRGVPGITVFPSLANYVLFRCEQAPADLYARLLREYGIAVRDCSNYRGMEDGSWFRAAVRLEEDHQRLADALRGILHPSVPVPPRPRSRAGRKEPARAFGEIFADFSSIAIARDALFEHCVRVCVKSNP